MNPAAADGNFLNHCFGAKATAMKVHRQRDAAQLESVRDCWVWKMQGKSWVFQTCSRMSIFNSLYLLLPTRFVFKLNHGTSLYEAIKNYFALFTTPWPPLILRPCTSIMGFQKKLQLWEFSLEILPGTETNAKMSSCSGRQAARIQLHAGWFNLVVLCWEEFKSRSKESFPFRGKSEGFSCIWVHTYIAHLHQHSSTALSSWEGSTLLLCHKLLEFSLSPAHCPQRWDRTGRGSYQCL